jgi:small subunit ribosomal protein S11
VNPRCALGGGVPIIIFPELRIGDGKPKGLGKVRLGNDFLNLLVTTDVLQGHRLHKTDAMSRTIARRLLALPPFWSRAEAPAACRQTLQCLHARPFSGTSRQRAEEDNTAQPPSPLSTTSQTPSNNQPKSNAPAASAPGPKSSKLSELGELFARDQSKRGSGSSSLLDNFGSFGSSTSTRADFNEEPHHFHVYATRHNTHITLTRPNREPILSLACGNIGFRKSHRKHYDSAFQLAAYTMNRILDMGLIPQIRKLEVVLRGFGAGREAVTKALLGQEGKLLRGKIVKVSDATRLKFGGTRSPKPRRLG